MAGAVGAKPQHLAQQLIIMPGRHDKFALRNLFPGIRFDIRPINLIVPLAAICSPRHGVETTPLHQPSTDPGSLFRRSFLLENKHSLERFAGVKVFRRRVAGAEAAIQNTIFRRQRLPQERLVKTAQFPRMQCPRIRFRAQQFNGAKADFEVLRNPRLME